MLNQDFKEFIESLNDNQVRSGVEFAACYAARIVVEMDGVVVKFIDLENLIKNKRASGRMQDLADVENLQ